MAYIKEWEVNLREKKTKDLLKFQDALKTLIEWEMFLSDHPYLKILSILIDLELEIRK